MPEFVTDTILLKKVMIDRKIERITQLSEVTGVNRKTLGDVLRGKTQPSAAVMGQLVRVLDIPPETAGQIFFQQKLT